MPLSIVYRVSIPDPQTHLVHVQTTVVATGTQKLRPSLVLSMPVWTPGSYLVREYARHVEGLAVDAPCRAIKIRKNAWRVDTADSDRAIVRYRVYAGELTVRTSHVDDTHAFLVGAALFLGVEGHETLGAQVEIEAPKGWRAATSLPRSEPAGVADGVLRFDAADFDALVDSPIELGTHREEAFDVTGKPHRYAIWPAGSVGDADVRRLVEDSKKIVETEAKLFGGSLPYDSYDLLLHLSARGRGGLEHNASAALIAPPTSFATRDAYLDLLSLVAHEALHAWNVKRIRPAGLLPYRYGEECYTRLLWWFEGATSYYDWRVLLLAKLCTVEEYLDHLASEIAYLDQTPGRLVHGLEDASYDAWIKLYRPDENSQNSSISYYRKGEVVCALLDLEVRARSGGRGTLDDVLAHLWREYGATGQPVPEDGMQQIFERVAGAPMGDLFDAWVRGAVEIDYGSTFAKVGLLVDRSSRQDAVSSSLGVRIRSDSGRSYASSSLRESGAWWAGIDPGDEIIAVGGVRIDGTNLDPALRGRAPGDTVDVVVARDGKLLTKKVVLGAANRDRVKLLPKADAPAGARTAFAEWLGQSHPGWASPADRTGLHAKPGASQ